MEADKDFITVALNEARMAGKGSITVHSDLLGLDLLAVDLDRRTVQWVVREGEHDAAVGEMARSLGEGLARDLPTFLDLRETLQSSMFLPPINLGVLMSEVYRMNDRRKDPYRFPKQMCFGLDTNLLYRRLFTRLLLAGRSCGVREFDPEKVQVLIPSLAEEEISRRVGHKYDKKDVEELRRATRGRNVADDLFNCLGKGGRKAMNGQTEVALMKERYNCWSVQGGAFTDDKELRDDEMLRAVAEEMTEQRLEVLFLTSDDKTRAHANAHKVSSLLMTYPYEIPTTLTYDPWLLTELLYDLSILHVSISLKGTGLRIKGEWMGKTVDDYRHERLKMSAPEDSALVKALSRDLRVISLVKGRFPWRTIR
jgi:hypothetical protein